MVLRLRPEYGASPSRGNTLSMKPSLAPQSSANVVPWDDTNGMVQPIRALQASIWASGMWTLSPS